MKRALTSLKSKYKVLSLSILSAILCVALVLGLTSLFKRPTSFVSADVKQDIQEELNTSFKDKYWVNEKVVVSPEFVVEVDGQPVTAEGGIIIFPNGLIQGADTYTLSMVGDYAVRYFINDATDYVEKNFFVGEKLVSLTVEDVNNTITAVSAEEQAGEKFANNSSPVTVQGKDALIVNMKEGTELNYSKTIDLFDTDENGLCTLISLDYHLFDVEDKGTSYQMTNDISATQCFVRIYDAYDSNIFVDLSYNIVSQAGGYTQSGTLNVKAYNQVYYYGCYNYDYWPSNWNEYSFRKKFEHVDGNTYPVGIEKTPILGRAGSNVHMYTHQPITWKYDPVNQYVYAHCGNTLNEARDYFVAPLNSTYIQTIRTFSGFPSGKVKIKIYTTNWKSNTPVRLDIFRLGNDSGSAFLDEFKNGYLRDEGGAPIIDLGITPTYQGAVYAPLNSEFNVPVPKSIIGMAENTDYTVSAYVNYGSNTQFQVPIVDGKLNINQKATYTLRYTAVGEKGGIGEALLPIIVKSDEGEGIKLNLNSNFFNGSFTTGQSITLPEHTFVSYNRVEDLKVTIKAVHERGETIINPTSRLFVPLYVGDYKIVYQYSDNVYNITKEFDMSVSVGNNVNFIDEIVLPRYFVKDVNYSLPNISAYVIDGSDNPATVNTTVSVSYDNGSSWTVVDRSNVKITGSDTVIVKYSSGNAVKVSEPVKIVDVSSEYGISLNKYFIHDNFTVTEMDWEEWTNFDIVYSSTITSGSNTLEFVNPVDVTKFDFTFRTFGENTNYNRVNIILRDYYDINNKYVISYINDGGQLVISLNGGAPIATDTAFNTISDKVVLYNGIGNILNVDNVASSIRFADYFTSSLVYLDVELEGIYGSSDITIFKVCGHNLTNSDTSDLSGPRISVDDIAGSYELNHIITLAPPTVSDAVSSVLDKDVLMTVYYVKDRSFIDVYDVNGVLIKNVSALTTYNIKLDKLGEYRVTYRVKDSNGVSYTENYKIVVNDNEPPVLEFNEIDLTQIRINVGDSIDARFTVSDNISSEEEIRVGLWVRDLKTNVNYTCHADEENGIPFGLIKFAYAGEFEVYAFAQDATGNYTYKTFKVIVEEK